MSLSQLSGPQQVTLTAQRMQECPHLAESWTLVSDISGARFADGDLLRFAGVKVLTDELANRLPNMRTKLPPYGLPDSDDSQPLSGSETLQTALARLNQLYKAKLGIHFDDELQVMRSDPQLQAIVASKYRTTAQLEAGASNSVDTMTGMLAIMPEVLGGEAEHAAVIEVAKNSKRLPVIPSLLGRTALDMFRISATHNGMENKQQPWGWAFRPELFTVFSDVRTHKTYIDFDDGIDSLDLTEHWEITDEMTEAHFKSLPPRLQKSFIPLEVRQASRPHTLGEFRKSHRPLTCPARRLIIATWADMLDIVDRERLFELKS